MNGVLLSLIVFAAVAAAVSCVAALLVTGALGATAFLPRGTPLADGLRRFAGEVPRYVWHMVRMLNGLVFAVAAAVAVVLTFALA
jgi:hypothetical protein